MTIRYGADTIDNSRCASLSSPGSRKTVTVQGDFVQNEVKAMHDIISDGQAVVFNDIKLSDSNALRRSPKPADFIKSISQVGNKLPGKKVGIVSGNAQTTTVTVKVAAQPRMFPLEKNWQDASNKK